MALPDRYTIKPKSVAIYFDALLNAEPPTRFSYKFMENIGFKSTNDRLLVGILKELGFLNRDGVPQKRYFDFLDRAHSKQVLAEGIRHAYSDLFNVNVSANKLSVEEAKNKLRTLYAGKKPTTVITNIAKTFKALCNYADFSNERTSQSSVKEEHVSPSAIETIEEHSTDIHKQENNPPLGKIRVGGLQYHINIVLPESQQQAVYDAIFKSLREHLG
jgi:hypothetical protein